MHNIFLQAHRGFAYLELLLVALFIIALLTVILGYSGKVSKLLRKSTLFVMIFFHIQFLIGIIMLVGTSGFMDTIKAMGMGGLDEKFSSKIHLYRASFLYAYCCCTNDNSE